MKALRVVVAGLGLSLTAVAAPAKNAPPKADASKGKEVFAAQSCDTCHSIGTDKKMGPGLKGLFSRAKLHNGKKPSEETVRGVIEKGGGGMPPYDGMLTPKEKADLIAYLKTL